MHKNKVEETRENIYNFLENYLIFPTETSREEFSEEFDKLLDEYGTARIFKDCLSGNPYENVTD